MSLKQNIVLGEHIFCGTETTEMIALDISSTIGIFKNKQKKPGYPQHY